MADGHITFPEIASVDTPSSGYGRLYVKTDGTIHFVNDAGTDTDLTAGSASPLTTKGDLYTYSTVDARLAVGSIGQVLVPDTSETTGLKWVTLPQDVYRTNEGSDYTTTSSAWGDIDGTNFSFTITPQSDTVIIGFSVTLAHSSGTAATYFDVYNSTDSAYASTLSATNDDGLVGHQVNVNNQFHGLGYVVPYTGLTPETSYTFKLRWKTTGATATIYAGAGTANKDVHSQFWVKEVL